MEPTLTNLKKNGMKSPVSWSQKKKESGYPIFRGISALNQRVLKRKNERCTIHFSAESSNTELLFRTIHSAKQLSMYGAVASWCGEFAHLIPGRTHMIMEKSVAKENYQLSPKLEPQEVDSLVQTPRRKAGNRLRVDLRKFEELETDGQFTKVCECPGFMRRVSVGVHLKTIHERGHSGSTKRQREVHFATLMDICPLKKAELEPKYQKYKGRVVLRGDICRERTSEMCERHNSSGLARLVGEMSRQEHAQNARYLVMTQNLKSSFGCTDIPELVQFSKSRPHAVLTSTESKFR